MVTYTNEYSSLPLKVLELHHYKDIDDSVASLINQIKQLQSEGQYNRVNEIISNNPELQPYIFSAENWNALEEETRNVEILAKAKKQQVYCQLEEPDGGNFNIWIEID